VHLAIFSQTSGAIRGDRVQTVGTDERGRLPFAHRRAGIITQGNVAGTGADFEDIIFRGGGNGIERTGYKCNETLVLLPLSVTTTTKEY
jgi:hypothetical protein